jgi:hypothetical protein
MKTLPYKRIEKVGTGILCTMRFDTDVSVILDFGKDKLKLPVDFVADSIEHYLEYIIKETLCRSKKARRKKQ